ncbi:uncharacterized protein LOC121486942 [Vulpes lagopus]|uniref:uncharacterized protein LOC121486942 n=1 Tax=Vulpes lagopus TaxID=494514 RepID=UPI001BC9A5EF|nr:uncharacterized protein LOC121486942 [Vulpes lagopus]
MDDKSGSPLATGILLCTHLPPATCSQGTFTGSAASEILRGKATCSRPSGQVSTQDLIPEWGLPPKHTWSLRPRLRSRSFKVGVLPPFAPVWPLSHALQGLIHWEPTPADTQEEAFTTQPAPSCLPARLPRLGGVPAGQESEEPGKLPDLLQSEEAAGWFESELLIPGPGPHTGSCSQQPRCCIGGGLPYPFGELCPLELLTDHPFSGKATFPFLHWVGTPCLVRVSLARRRYPQIAARGGLGPWPPRSAPPLRTLERLCSLPWSHASPGAGQLGFAGRKTGRPPTLVRVSAPRAPRTPPLSDDTRINNTPAGKSRWSRAGAWSGRWISAPWLSYTEKTQQAEGRGGGGGTPYPTSKEAFAARQT